MTASPGETECMLGAESSPSRSKETRPNNTNNERAEVTTSTKKSRFRNWALSFKLGVAGWAVLAFASLIVNIVLTAVVRTRYGFDGGLGTLLDGDCDRVQYANSGLHIVVNVLSTLLLAGSNYCMQCLAAPTREEIDYAHVTRHPLDIGTPSLSNFKMLPRRKVVLWSLFSLSSAPLHLLYNSVIYNSIATNGYQVLAVNHAFTTLGHYNAIDNLDSFFQDPSSAPITADRPALSAQVELLRQRSIRGDFEKLDATECIKKYFTDFLTDRGTLLLVTPSGFNSSNDTSQLIFNFGKQSLFYSASDHWLTRSGCDSIPPYAWMCDFYDTSETCIYSPTCENRPQDLIDNNRVGQWKPLDIEVDHCLSEKVEGKCKLYFSLPIAIIIICFNLAKGVMMLYIAIRMDDNRILTIGDAIKSYLKQPEECTKGCCLHSTSDFARDRFASAPWTPRAQPWSSKRVRFFKASTTARWISLLSLYSLTIGLSASLFKLGTSGQDKKKLLNLGLGTPSSQTQLSLSLPQSGPAGLTGTILLANFPQLLLSIIYFSYNATLTSMMAGIEWSKYAHHRKGLRVSANAAGAQRSSYFLQLPYRYAVPLLLASGLMQWLVSQTVFMVALEYRVGEGAEGEGGYGTVYSCGWSPLAVLCVIVLSSVMVVAVVGTGCRRYPEGMPFRGTDSGVISAACHWLPGVDEDGLESLKVKWGVVPGAVGVNGKAELHCAFSSKDPGFPEEGKKYA